MGRGKCCSFLCRSSATHRELVVLSIRICFIAEKVRNASEFWSVLRRCRHELQQLAHATLRVILNWNCFVTGQSKGLDKPATGALAVSKVNQWTLGPRGSIPSNSQMLVY